MITFVGGSPFSTSFASLHSWRVRQSDNYHHVDHYFYNFDDDNVEDFDDEDDEHDNKADFSWRVFGCKIMLGTLMIMIILTIKMMANGMVLKMI